MSSYLRIQDLAFKYCGRPVLLGICLEIQPGELCAVVGQSGAGKSTLIKCLLQAEWPTAGKVDYSGILASYGDVGNVARRPDLSIIRRLGYVPQTNLLFPHMSAIRNVTLALTEVHGKSSEDAQKIATSAMEMVGVADLARSPPWRLSGGQQQRVAIARALALRPCIFLLDEPTSAIDSFNSQKVAQVLRNDLTNRRACGLLVTHNLTLAKKHCHSVALLVDGHIKWHLRTDEVRVEQALAELG